jgi:hypothetical protein
MAETATQDMAEHRRTYAQFIRLTKWGTISVVVLLMLMWAFLVHH